MLKENKLLFFIFILIFMLSLFFFNYGNDFYWHIKVGEYIINNNKIPYIDIFSWYANSNSLSWISHEWLFEVIIYLYSIVFSKFGSFLYYLLGFDRICNVC